MKPEADDIPIDVTLFDEVADLAVDDRLSREEIREVAGLLDGLVAPSETDPVCRRVRGRLFSGAPVGRTHGRPRSRPVLPGWIGIAAVLALFVTALALFEASRLPAPQVDHFAVVDKEAETELMFPGEAVLDSMVARLEVELASATGEAFWSSDSTFFEGISQ